MHLAFLLNFYFDCTSDDVSDVLALLLAQRNNAGTSQIIMSPLPFRCHMTHHIR